jgi:hypothetical protein
MISSERGKKYRGRMRLTAYFNVAPLMFHIFCANMLMHIPFDFEKYDTHDDAKKKSIEKALAKKERSYSLSWTMYANEVSFPLSRCLSVL